MESADELVEATDVCWMCSFIVNAFIYTVYDEFNYVKGFLSPKYLIYLYMSTSTSLTHLRTVCGFVLVCVSQVQMTGREEGVMLLH